MRLLLVCFDPVRAEARAAALTGLHHGVDVETEDGERAYRAARQGRPDAVVVDLGVRPSHGHALLAPLASQRADADPQRLVALDAPDPDARVEALGDRVEAVAWVDLAIALGGDPARARAAHPGRVVVVAFSAAREAHAAAAFGLLGHDVMTLAAGEAPGADVDHVVVTAPQTDPERERLREIERATAETGAEVTLVPLDPDWLAVGRALAPGG